MPNGTMRQVAPTPRVLRPHHSHLIAEGSCILFFLAFQISRVWKALRDEWCPLAEFLLATGPHRHRVCSLLHLFIVASHAESTLSKPPANGVVQGCGMGCRRSYWMVERHEVGDLSFMFGRRLQREPPRTTPPLEVDRRH